MLNEVLTIAEASLIWGLERSTLRKAFKSGKRFVEGVDYRKSKDTWLVTREAMLRIYGEV